MKRSSHQLLAILLFLSVYTERQSDDLIKDVQPNLEKIQYSTSRSLSTPSHEGSKSFIASPPKTNLHLKSEAVKVMASLIK